VNEQELTVLQAIHDDLSADPEYEFSDEQEATLLHLIDEDFVEADSTYGVYLTLTRKGKIALGLAVPDTQERLL
jgi:hypothetical protein